ncbi:MAG: ATP-binding protein, partial [Bdellovibrio sp.]
MKKDIKINFINDLENQDASLWSSIQVILGPRQVGKTTGVQQFLSSQVKTPSRYLTADGQISKSGQWLELQWLQFQQESPDGLLVIDEIQKVENWSEIVKKLWDQQAQSKKKLRVIVLGSSSLEIQKGLSESLTGRFFLHRVHQWNLSESARAYGLDFEEYLKYGGYPGSYELRKDRQAWLSYVKNSIIETVIGRDILTLSRVKSPALFRQCFDLACSYGAQEISYTKLLGQLQDRGNVDLVKHYLELFEGAFLLKQLSRYSAKKTLSRASSPKILPLCPALYSVTLDAEYSLAERGRAVELAVGAARVRLRGQRYSWRAAAPEVEYV